MLIKYTASNFRNECTIDEDFKSYLDKMNDIAKELNITVIVNSSFRVDANVKGAIVKPATHSNHMVAHAVDTNLIYDGEYYNSTAMLKDNGAVKTFINKVIASGMRWGGNFTTPDAVHFDDDLYHKNPIKWNILYREYHLNDSQR